MTCEIINNMFKFAYDNYPTIISTISLIISCVVGYKQIIITKAKNRQELFDKRYAIFRAFKALASAILINADVEKENIDTFISDTEKTQLLFGAEVVEYRKEFREKANGFKAFKKMEKVDKRSQEDRLDKDDEYRKYFSDSFKKTDELFKKYIDLSN